jgi:hypothetical protein
MKIIKIAQISQQDDEMSLRNVFEEIKGQVSHYNDVSLNNDFYVSILKLREICKRRPDLILFPIKKLWLDLIRDNKSYLYKFIIPESLKNEQDIKNLVRNEILEEYENYLQTAIELMIRYDETEKIFIENDLHLTGAFSEYIIKYPENYKKHRPKALTAHYLDNTFFWEALSNFTKKFNLSNYPDALLALLTYKTIPPEFKTEHVIKHIEKFLISLFLREPYLYEKECPLDFKKNGEILKSRKTGWINLLDQKSPLLYGSLPKDLKQDEDFFRYREPAKKALMGKLLHPKEEKDPSIQVYVDLLLEEFKDEDFMVSAFWKNKHNENN